jgi:tyrosinase
MRLFSIWVAAGIVGAVHLPRQSQNDCANPVKRVEWRTLSDTVRKSYIEAVLCLKTKPSRLGLSTPLYDDFAYVHRQLNNESKV